MEREYFSKWEHSNYINLLAMRRSISEHLLSGLPETATARELLTALGERYLVPDMAKSSVLLKKSTSMSYDNVGGVRDYILKMISLQSKLKSLEIPLPEKFIILHALNSLPPNFSQIKTAFICQNESWTVNDLISKCMVEGEKFKRERSESTFLVSSSRPFVKSKKHAKRFHPSAYKNRGFKRHDHDQSEGGSRFVFKKDVKCFYCQKPGYLKKDCFKLKARLEQNKSRGVQEYKETKSKGYRFYCPNRGRTVIDSMNAKFLEFDVADDVSTGVDGVDTFEQNERVFFPLPIPRNAVSIVPSDVVEHTVVNGSSAQPASFSQDTSHENGVWELVDLPDGHRPVGRKWVFKTKRDANGKVDRYKARLVAKGFTKKPGIDYTETFSPVSSKDGFRIIMALVAHYDLELHQMDVKTVFLNGSLEEDVYMVQPEGFEEIVKEYMVCTSPDIAFAVSVLDRYQSNPGPDHWMAAKKVMMYLKRTRDYMLVYMRLDNLEVVGYTDSDFGTCPDDRKSTSGYIFMMAGGAISWKSVKQTLTASSTMQAEFVACYGAVTHTI
ncbi:hypothetical protein MLD38_019154 [Melastoma candidum]|uniref:Uncharacterized protein n=1 Tax=Melastoma candidum TaxID=119954 RepID=A0ACB9QX65_9MYRT|nr:hypothetical protein MLD38_019154 [Melastoma candidum]